MTLPVTKQAMSLEDRLELKLLRNKLSPYEDIIQINRSVNRQEIDRILKQLSNGNVITLPIDFIVYEPANFHLIFDCRGFSTKMDFRIKLTNDQRRLFISTIKEGRNSIELRKKIDT